MTKTNKKTANNFDLQRPEIVVLQLKLLGF